MLTIISLLLCLVGKILIKKCSMAIPKGATTEVATTEVATTEATPRQRPSDALLEIICFQLQSGRSELKDPSSLETLAVYALPISMTLAVILFIIGLVLRYFPTSLKFATIGMAGGGILLFIVTCIVVGCSTQVKAALSKKKITKVYQLRT